MAVLRNRRPPMMHPSCTDPFFQMCMVFVTACFAGVFPEKWLELKSLKRQTKAEELGDQVPERLSLRLPLKAL